MKTRSTARLFVFAMTTALLGCASSPPAGPYYYLMHAQALASQSIQLPKFKLGLGPLNLPSHLEREGILTYNDQSQLDYSDNHRWAEPLQENVLQVLQTNINRLLPNQHIVYFPWKQTDRPKFQIIASITQFGFRPNGQVVLSAVWEVTDDNGNQLTANKLDLSKTSITRNYSEIVKVQSELLAALSANIVQGIAANIEI